MSKDFLAIFLAILIVIILTFIIYLTIILIYGYAKIDNICAELGIKGILKCGIINPAFQNQDIQNRIQGDLNIKLDK